VSKIQAVIFDLYGTLVDISTDEGKMEIYTFLSDYLQYYDINFSPEKLKIAFEQEKAANLNARHERYPEVDFKEVFDAVIKREGNPNSFLVNSCCKLFRLLSRERMLLFPDSVPVLNQIKENGFILGLVSNAQRVFTANEMRILGIKHYFKHIVFSTRFGITKPDHRLFLVACAMLDVRPENAVYIGDNPDNDVRGARKIGMTTILLSRQNKVALPGSEPDYTAKDLWEAWSWIKQKNQDQEKLGE
jgi:putative hydrolase of the HAD superfamily